MRPQGDAYKADQDDKPKEREHVYRTRKMGPEPNSPNELASHTMAIRIKTIIAMVLNGAGNGSSVTQ